MKGSFRAMAGALLASVAAGFSHQEKAYGVQIGKTAEPWENKKESQGWQPGRTRRKAKKPLSQRQNRRNSRRAFAAGNRKAFA